MPPVGPRDPRNTGALPPPRVLVRGDVLAYPPTGQPQGAADLTHSYDLIPGCEPCGRTLDVGPDWRPLLRGTWADEWPGPPSLLCVESLAGTELGSIPSPEARAALYARVVELGVMADPAPIAFAVVRPGRSHLFEPAEQVWARCPNGPVKVKVAALPPAAPPGAHPGLATLPSETVARGDGFAGGPPPREDYPLPGHPYREA